MSTSTISRCGLRVSSIAGCLSIAAAAAIFVPAASASQLIDRDATSIHLQVNQGQALLRYRAHGVTRRVLAWGAVNARLPSSTVPQVKFRLNYRGFGFNGGGCAPYTGPSLPWLVVACDGPDGSFWAVQSFPQPLPDLGYTPWTSAQRMRWLELSHWTGPVPQLTVGQDWVYGGRFREVYGRLMYLGQPVYGLHTTRYGVAHRRLREPRLCRRPRCAGVRTRLATRELLRHPQGPRVDSVTASTASTRPRAATTTRRTRRRDADPASRRSTGSPRTGRASHRMSAGRAQHSDRTTAATRRTGSSRGVARADRELGRPLVHGRPQRLRALARTKNRRGFSTSISSICSCVTPLASSSGTIFVEMCR